MREDSSIHIRITLTPPNHDRAMELAEDIYDAIERMDCVTSIVTCSPYVDVLQYEDPEDYDDAPEDC